MAIKRESQILAIFDSMGYGVVFDMDGAARFVRKKNLQRMFNYCRGGSLVRQFRTPITSAGCPTTRSEEFLRTIPPVCPSFGLGTRIRGNRYSRPCTRCVNERCLSELFPLSFNIDFRSIMNKRMELKPFIYFNFSVGLRITDGKYVKTQLLRARFSQNFPK